MVELALTTLLTQQAFSVHAVRDLRNAEAFARDGDRGFGAARLLCDVSWNPRLRGEPMSFYAQLEIAARMRPRNVRVEWQGYDNVHARFPRVCCAR